MAQKKITDLTLRSDFDASVNLPGDDSIQTWRVTGDQVKDFVVGDAVDDSTLEYTGGVLQVKDGGIPRVKLQNKRNIVAKTANYTLTDDDDVVTVDATGGAFTLTLPAASGRAGRVYEIIRIDGTLANQVTIDGNSSETIGGALTRKLYTLREAWKIICDGSNWQILNHETKTAWTAYTPSFTGLGSVSSISMFWRRVGDTAEIHGTFQVGTTSATPAIVSLPGAYNLDSAKVTSSTILGNVAHNGDTGQTDVMYALYHSTPGAGGFTISRRFGGASDDPLGSSNASSILASSQTVSVCLTVPISGWDE